jgi:hypothetical protein
MTPAILIGATIGWMSGACLAFYAALRMDRPAYLETMAAVMVAGALIGGLLAAVGGVV